MIIIYGTVATFRILLVYFGTKDLSQLFPPIRNGNALSFFPISARASSLTPSFKMHHDGKSIKTWTLPRTLLPAKRYQIRWRCRIMSKVFYRVIAKSPLTSHDIRDATVHQKGWAKQNPIKKLSKSDLSIVCFLWSYDSKNWENPSFMSFFESLKS